MQDMKNRFMNMKYRNSIFASNSETLEASNNEQLFDGHTKLSRYILTTFSKTSLSLNKNPVNITNLRIHRSAVFFCKKSNRKPSTHNVSFRKQQVFRNAVDSTASSQQCLVNCLNLTVKVYNINCINYHLTKDFFLVFLAELDLRQESVLLA